MTLAMIEALVDSARPGGQETKMRGRTFNVLERNHLVQFMTYRGTRHAFATERGRQFLKKLHGRIGAVLD